MDVESGEVLFSRNADTRRYPASLTKIADALSPVRSAGERESHDEYAAQGIQTGGGSAGLQTRVAARQNDPVEDAIKALVVKSANDVATVVAEALGGTEVKFARMMTEKAKALGMKRTQFRNASGLPNRRQLSTARDMARLGIAVQRDFPKYYAYFRTNRFKWGGRTYRSHNRLLGNYKGTDGVKTATSAPPDPTSSPRSVAPKRTSSALSSAASRAGRGTGTWSRS